MAAKGSDGQPSQIPQSMRLSTSSNRLVRYMCGEVVFFTSRDQVGDFNFSKDVMVKISQMRPKCMTCVGLSSAAGSTKDIVDLISPIISR